MNRDLVDVLREVHDGVADSHHLALARSTAALEIGIGDLPPDLAECCALVGIGDDDEVPVLAVARGRGLLGEAEALLEHLALDRPREVEALPNRAGRREELVRGQIEEHVSRSYVLGDRRPSRGAGYPRRARPRSSADRAAAFEAACGGSIPPGAVSPSTCLSSPVSPRPRPTGR